MTTSIIKAIEDEKNEIRDGIGQFGLDTREKIAYWGNRLRLLQPKIRGEFTQYLATLPISEKTAYNWINAAKQISEGKKADKISDLFTYEPKGQFVKVTNSDSVLTSTYDKKESETDLDDESETEENDDDFDVTPRQKPVSVQAHVIDNDKTLRDRFGQEIPETLTKVFTEAVPKFTAWKKTLAVMKADVLERLGNYGYTRLDKRTVEARFANLVEIFRIEMPYCICPVCQGDGGIGGGCKVCAGRGEITKAIFDRLDDDLKIGLTLTKEED